MLKNVLALLVPVLVFAIVADATRSGPDRAPARFCLRPDDSMLVKLDSIPSRTQYQCIYVRNDTVFCALQDQAVHLRDRLTGAMLDSFTTQSATSACAVCAFGDSICVSHLTSPEFCEVYTLAGTYVRSFTPTGGVQVRGLHWDGTQFWATSYASDLVIYLMTPDGTVTKTLTRSGGVQSTIARDLVLDPMYPNRLWSSPSNGVPNYLMYVAFDTAAGTFTPLDTFNTGLGNYMAGIGFRNDPADGGCVYVSTFHDSCIWRYRVHEPNVGVEEEPRLPASGFALAVGPNPASAPAVVSFTSSGPADISIYEADGRPVRSLVSGAMEPGVRHATWDLADDRGRPVASGVYFCRLTAAGTTLSRKLVVQR
ncbi:T9SS type A sorting domain-containing protein [candidate division WOR-3 bacterium]|nr:T9SS type A sorting domain-containing protein [candidate division WOR-3 bacterium]